MSWVHQILLRFGLLQKVELPPKTSEKTEFGLVQFVLLKNNCLLAYTPRDHPDTRPTSILVDYIFVFCFLFFIPYLPGWLETRQRAPRLSRGAWRYCLGHRVLSCMTCVVNFVFALSQLQGVEWGWPGRREPDDEHSPAS